MAPKSIELKVAEALQNDVGRGLVRIDSRARKELDVSTGDIVELRGKRTTAALVWQAHPQDEGLSIIRMDGYLRQNTGVALGDKVIIKKAELKEAKKVVLAPSQPMKYSPGFDQFVKKKLIGRALTRGDTIFIGVFGTSFPLMAAIVQPSGIVLVNENTELLLKEEPIKEAGGAVATSISYEDIGGASHAPPRAFRKAWHRSPKRRAYLRPSWHRQNFACKSCCIRIRGKLHTHSRP